MGCHPVYCKMFSIILLLSPTICHWHSLQYGNQKCLQTVSNVSSWEKLLWLRITELSELKKIKCDKRPTLWECWWVFISYLQTRKQNNDFFYLSYIQMLEQLIFLSKQCLLKSSMPSLTMMRNSTTANGNMVISLWKTSIEGIQLIMTRNRK